MIHSASRRVASRATNARVVDPGLAVSTDAQHGDRAPESRAFRHAGRILSLSIFVMGACGLAYEYTLGALGNHLMGSSHQQIFIVIGLMMFAMGIGSVLQRGVHGELVDKWLALEILLGLVGGISVLAIYATFAFTTQYNVVLYLFAGAIGLAIGMEIPLLIRINEEYASNLSANLGQILMMDYVGSLVGALLFAYVLITRLTLMHIAASLGLVNVLLGIGATIYFWPLIRWRRLLPLLGGASAAILFALFFIAEPLVAALEQRTFRDPIVFRETTRYQHLVLTRRDDRLSLFINGHLQFCSDDEEIYHELLVHMPMALAPRRARVLILGGGDGLALREVLSWPDVRHVTLVDLDRRVLELGANQPDLVSLNEGALVDARVHLHAGASSDDGQGLAPRRAVSRPFRGPGELGARPNVQLAEVELLAIDADLYLREASGPFDVAILDFPDPTSLEVAKLYSQEFYRRLRVVLAPDAAVAVQSGSPYHAREVFLCIGATLRAAGFETLPYHHNVPSFGEWGWHLAWRPAQEGAPNFGQRLRELETLEVADFASPDLLRAARVFGRGVLEGEVRPSSQMRPVILEYARRAWKDV